MLKHLSISNYWVSAPHLPVSAMVLSVEVPQYSFLTWTWIPMSPLGLTCAVTLISYKPMHPILKSMPRSRRASPDAIGAWATWFRAASATTGCAEARGLHTGPIRILLLLPSMRGKDNPRQAWCGTASHNLCFLLFKFKYTHQRVIEPQCRDIFLSQQNSKMCILQTCIVILLCSFSNTFLVQPRHQPCPSIWEYWFTTWKPTRYILSGINSFPPGPVPPHGSRQL